MMDMMEKYANNLEDLVNQRTLEVYEEKRKTEDLLHRMLPAWVSCATITINDKKRRLRIHASSYLIGVAPNGSIVIKPLFYSRKPRIKFRTTLKAI